MAPTRPQDAQVEVAQPIEKVLAAQPQTQSRPTSRTPLDASSVLAVLDLYGPSSVQLKNTVEAPRHEAGFRVIFGPQNEALQVGYGAGNIDRPASPKVPIKNEARKRSFF